MENKSKQLLQKSNIWSYPISLLRLFTIDSIETTVKYFLRADLGGEGWVLQPFQSTLNKSTSNLEDLILPGGEVGSHAYLYYEKPYRLYYEQWQFIYMYLRERLHLTAHTINEFSPNFIRSYCNSFLFEFLLNFQHSFTFYIYSATINKTCVWNSALFMIIPLSLPIELKTLPLIRIKLENL